MATILLAGVFSNLGGAERLLKFSVITARAEGNVQKASARVIRSQEEWDAFVMGVGGVGERIDFGQSTVVAIFAGERRTGGYSVKVEKVVEGGKRRATVHYQVVEPAKGSITIQAITYPQTIIRIAKKLETVEFQPPLDAATR